MGLISKILSFTRTERNDAKVSEVKADSGGDNNIVSDHYSAPGDDSFPLKTDFQASMPIEGSGRRASIGYVDPLNDPVSTEGEKRIYSRDPATGLVKGVIHLRYTGIVQVNEGTDSAVGYTQLLVAFNKLKSDHDLHFHNTTATIGATATVGAISPPTVLSTADMTPAEVPEVKLP